MQSETLVRILIVILFSFPFSLEASGVRDSIRWRSIDGKTGVAKCHDGGKVCVDRGEKIIEKIRVSRDCWRWNYEKICDFPSKNDCHLIAHCYELGLRECLMHDQMNNCVNRKKEFSCKSWEKIFLDREKVKQQIKGDEAKKLVCKGIPCVDGNCVDKSYEMDDEMMESVSQLHAISQMKDGGTGSNLFPGAHDQCTKKPAGYLSCCKVKGWGTNLGAHCNADELALHQKRERGLCEYALKTTSGTTPFHVNKHHFCCFKNVFTRVFQVEARKQIFRGRKRDELFKNGDKADCRGLTIDEIKNLNFQEMDFSEFIHDVKKRMKIPNVGDLQMRIKDRFEPMKSKADKTKKEEKPQMNPENKRAGIDTKIMNQLEDESDYHK